MTNQVVIIGRLVRVPEIKQTENEKNYANVTIAVPRNYKNMNGEYDTDFIDFTVWDNIAQNVIDYCHKGDLIGVKGRMQSRKLDDGSKQMEIVGERITFLATPKKSTDEDVEIEKNI